MIVLLVIVLISLVFGFVFSRIDTLTKMCKMLKDEISQMQSEIVELKSKK